MSYPLCKDFVVANTPGPVPKSGSGRPPPHTSGLVKDKRGLGFLSLPPSWVRVEVITSVARTVLDCRGPRGTPSSRSTCLQQLGLISSVFRVLPSSRLLPHISPSTKEVLDLFRPKSDFIFPLGRRWTHGRSNHK